MFRHRFLLTSRYFKCSAPEVSVVPLFVPRVRTQRQNDGHGICNHLPQSTVQHVADCSRTYPRRRHRTDHCEVPRYSAYPIRAGKTPRRRRPRAQPSRSQARNAVQGTRARRCIRIRDPRRDDRTPNSDRTPVRGHRQRHRPRAACSQGGRNSLTASTAYSGSRAIGQDMHRGPPRPDPSSEPAIRKTSIPEASSLAFVSTLRS